MKRLLFCCLSLLACLGLWAQEDVFDPENPIEPSVKYKYRVTLNAVPEGVAYVSGAGKYNPGDNIYINTSRRDEDYEFKYWLKDGEYFSDSPEFWYSIENQNVNFTAVYEMRLFDPSSPSDPSSASNPEHGYKWPIYLTCEPEGACSFNYNNGDRIAPTSAINITAYPNPGYQLLGWYEGNRFVSDKNPLQYVMPASQVVLKARFEYDPDDPSDPAGTGQDNVDTSATVNAESIDLSDVYMSLLLGETAQLTAKVSPANTTYPTVKWKTSNATVAVVSKAGKISTIGIGQATITATCGNASATCLIDVKPIEAEKLVMSSEEKHLYKGQQSDLYVTILPVNTTDKTVKWTSYNPLVATVSETGTVTAHSEGETWIEASCGYVDAVCQIIVDPTPVGSLAFEASTLTLQAGQSAMLTPIISPADATDKGLIWNSSNPEVALVHFDGKVTAISPGETLISITSHNKHTASMTVNVVEAPTEGVIIGQASMALEVGESQKLTAEVLPANADDLSLTWSSSDKSIASVDTYGNVVGASVGTATITATNGSFSSSCVVTVKPKLPEKIELSISETTLYIGQTAAITAIITPTYASDQSVTWSTSAPSVAYVADGNIIAKSIGYASIYATTSNGQYAICEVRVEAQPSEGVVLDKSALDMKIGQTSQLKATVLPITTTDKTIYWDSSDYIVASVDNQGNITAYGEGQATITATNGDNSATCLVSVTPVTAEQVRLSQNLVKLYVGESKSIYASIYPENTTDQTIIWSSSDESIATVDQWGYIEALQIGDAVIYAHASNGVFGACTVSVIPTPSQSISISDNNIELMRTRSIQLSAWVWPEETTDKTVIWTSENPGIADVDDDGVVTGVGIGTTIISAINGACIANCRVTVTPLLVERIDLSINETDLYCGQRIEVTATCYPEDADCHDVSWQIWGEVASIDYCDGRMAVIIAGDLGSTTLTARANDDSYCEASCTINVVPTPLEGIIMSNTTLTMRIDDVIQLVATVLPENATDREISWASSDESIAIVDAWGNVQGLAEGSVTISATNAGHTATCEVTVLPWDCAYVSFDWPNITVIAGQSFTINVHIEPENTTDKTLTWTSSNESVAVVDEYGNVTTIDSGYAIISATAHNGIAAHCEVYVNPRPAEGIIIDEIYLTLIIGESHQLTATVYPDNADDKTLTWHSENDDIAVVDENGVVTAVGPGDTWIVVTNAQGYEARCQVISTPIFIQNIILSKTDVTMVEGEEVALTATVYPEDATYANNLVWWSGNPDVATVSSDGTVTALAPGQTNIYVNGDNVDASCNIYVRALDIQSIWMETDSHALAIGENWQITYSIIPYDALNNTLTWYSTDESVAIVDQNGLVTGVGEGEAWIVASAENGVSQSCRVEVFIPALEWISVEPNAIELLEGEVGYLEIKTWPEGIPGKYFACYCDDEEIATAECFGNSLEITARREGYVRIQIECDGCWAELYVTVYRQAEGIVDIDNDIDDETYFYRIDGIQVKGEKLLPGIYVQQKGNNVKLIKK